MLFLDFVSGLAISTIILLFRQRFYDLALNTTSLLNIVFDENLKEEKKFNLLLSNFKKTIKSLLFFILYLFFIISSFFIPFLIFQIIFKEPSLKEFINRKKRKKSKSDYS